MRPILFISVLACVSGPALAAWDSQRPVNLGATGPRTVTATPGSSVGGAIVPRTYLNAGNGLSVLRDMAKGPGPAGDVVDVVAKRVLTPRNVGRAIGRAMPVVGTAMAVKDLLDALRCDTDGTCDEGQPQRDLPTKEWRCEDSQEWYGTQQGAIERCRYFSNPTGPSWDPGMCVSEFRFVSLVGTTATYTLTGVAYNPDQRKCVAADHTYTRSIYSREAVQRRCPSIFVDGVEVVPLPGPDGLCPGGTRAPVTPDQLGEKVERAAQDAAAAAKVAAAAADAVARAVAIEHDPPQLEGPSTIFGGRETETLPDGSRRVTDLEYIVDYSKPGGYEWVPRQTSKVYPPGVEIPQPGKVDNPDQVVTNPGGSTPVETPVTCGLPTTPPCKIDETGTPAAVTLPEPGWAQWAARLQELMTPDTLPWQWTFGMPVGACNDLIVPSFGEALHGGPLGLCEQPALPFWRRLWGWVLGVLAAWYAWRRYSEAVGS